jgi:hypothetical protein
MIWPRKSLVKTAVSDLPLRKMIRLTGVFLLEILKSHHDEISVPGPCLTILYVSARLMPLFLVTRLPFASFLRSRESCVKRVLSFQTSETGHLLCGSYGLHNESDIEEVFTGHTIQSWLACLYHRLIFQLLIQYLISGGDARFQNYPPERRTRNDVTNMLVVVCDGAYKSKITARCQGQHCFSSLNTHKTLNNIQ